VSITIETAEQTFGVQVDEHHDRGLQIPVLRGLQFQGDVAVLPIDIDRRASIVSDEHVVPRNGVAVVRGEAGGNTHLLLGAPAAYWAPSDRAGTDPSDLDLGTLTVPDGSTAYLAHPEHAFAGIAPGSYILRRQREQADVERFVQD
jgi:hypothetical protein